MQDKHAKDEIWRAGLSAAVGVATKKEDDVPQEALIRISDRRMYENKGEYCQHHDRGRSCAYERPRKKAETAAPKRRGNM